MPVGEKRTRKTRSDKKIATAPTVLDEVYEHVVRISYLFDRHDGLELQDQIGHVGRIGAKTIGEALVEVALDSRELIEALAKHFYRDLMWNNVLFRPRTAKRFRPNFRGKLTQRLDMKFDSETWGRVEDVAFALGCQPATGCGVLITFALDRKECVLRVIARFAGEHVDKEQRRAIARLLRAMNLHAPEERVSLMMLLNLIAEEALAGARLLKEIVDEWMIRDPGIERSVLKDVGSVFQGSRR